MPRYVALLRGVMPTNAKMSELRRCWESAGFTDVKTVLGSGNIVFNARSATESALERRAEKAMRRELGRVFYPIVRSQLALQGVLALDPWARFRLPAGSKRVVTFMRERAEVKLSLPLEVDGARILSVHGREIFTAYLPGASGPTFMKLIEKTFGRNITTRTLETVRKCAGA
jgi:uncharacterized protein (DUF1697 family)